MEKVWDTETQEPHGGQTWSSLSNFLTDFSVTTNAKGAPGPALEAAKEALSLIHHYPPADNGDAIKALSEFTSFPPNQILLGNGASEFIDLVMKVLPPGPFRSGPYRAAYMEYNRAAIAAGRTVGGPETPAVTVIIRPNSPTGDYMGLEELRNTLDTAPGAIVLDESFMPFMGPDWREHSGLSLIDEYPEKLLVIASWTKLWSCPGLRLGSVSASERWIREIKKIQTPWSCNTSAQAFCVSACNDKDYMSSTWKQTKVCRAQMESDIKKLGWEVNENSPLWIPWVFVTCPDEEAADRAVRSAEAAGCPVRGCRSYSMPKCLRLGVRSRGWEELVEAWMGEFDCAASGNAENGNGNAKLHANGHTNGHA